MKPLFPKPAMAGSARFCSSRAFSLVEVLVALAIFVAGMLMIATNFPLTLKTQNEAELLNQAAALAQWKAEEIRRDNDVGGNLLNQIRQMATPSEPITFLTEPRLAYSFCGRSLLYDPAQYPGDPRSQVGVARVIIRYAPAYRPKQDVVYELRFN
jgi:prepilin-type N-terminal cleavage/methylation domain-containing protein